MKWDLSDVMTALKRIEKKIDLILEDSKIDLSSEDASVRSMEGQVVEAAHQIPPQQ